MSRVLIGSIRHVDAGARRLLRRPREVRRRRSAASPRASAPAGTSPAMTCTRGQPSAAAYSRARVEAAPELLLAAGQAGDAALAAGEVARRRVEQHLLQAVCSSFSRQAIVAGRLVREEVLDGLEAVAPRPRRSDRGTHAPGTSCSGWRRSAASRVSSTVFTSGRRTAAQLVDLRRRQRRGLRLAAEPEARGFLELLEDGHRRRRRLVPDVRAEPRQHHGADRRAARRAPCAIAAATCSATVGSPGRW